MGVVSLVLATCILYPLWTAKRLPREGIPGSDDTKYGYESLPIVVQLSHEFVTRLYYSPRPDRYFFILDWSSAVDETSGLFPPAEYKNFVTATTVPKDLQKCRRQRQIFEQPGALSFTYRQYAETPTGIRKDKHEHFQRPKPGGQQNFVDSGYRVRPIGDIGPYALLLVEKTAK